MMATDSQNALIKGWLLNGYSITQLEALTQFGALGWPLGLRTLETKV
jgi:hypothetical protein